jgi:hypothetical protein
MIALACRSMDGGVAAAGEPEFSALGSGRLFRPIRRRTSASAEGNGQPQFAHDLRYVAPAQLKALILVQKLI